MLVSIVVPVYNSTSTVEELARRVDEVFSARAEDDYELILVDDCSPNIATWPVLQKLAERYPSVVAMQLTRNFGQQGATLGGLRDARGEVAITMDDDLQHDPRDIPKLLEKADWDIVIAQFDEKKHGLFKRFTSRIKGYFDQILIGKPPQIQMSSFRLMKRIVVDAVLDIRTPNPFISALLFHVSKNVTGVTVTHHERKEGRSGYTLRAQWRVFSNLLINNSSFALKIVGYTGILMALLALTAAPVVIYKKLVYGVALQGWTSLFVLVLVTSGLLLFSVSVIGEYLIRIIDITESKSAYIVRQRVGRSTAEDDSA